MDYFTLHYCVTCLLIIVLNIIVLLVCDLWYYIWILQWTVVKDWTYPLCGYWCQYVFFGWSRQLPYQAVSSLLDISEVITREWYQRDGAELADVSKAVCTFHFFPLYCFSKNSRQSFHAMKNDSRITDSKIYHTVLPSYGNVMLMKAYCDFHKPAEIDQIRYFQFCIHK
jgi:hypothetical protein